MKKIFTLLIGFVLFAMPLVAQQDSVTSLIITEYYGGIWGNGYYELTNAGDSALHLKNFVIGILPNWSWLNIDWSGEIPKFPSEGFNHNVNYIQLLKLPDPNMVLNPGEVLLVKNVFDAPGNAGNELDWRRWSRNPTEFLNGGDIFIPVHVAEPGAEEFWNRPELEMWGKDSIDAQSNQYAGNMGGGRTAVLVFYTYPNGDYVLVDQVRLARNTEGGTRALSGTPSDVAGVSQASLDYTLVRKANVTKGNTNWDLARGTDIADSEWIPIYNYMESSGVRATPFTTVGTHGDFHINLSSSTVTIDEANSKLTVPWGIIKGDSLLDEFEVGPGMGWYYQENTAVLEDSAFTTVQTGDTIRFVAVGNTLEEKVYAIEMSAPANNVAKVFPKRRPRYEAMEDVENWNGVYWGGTPYYVTENVPGMDSIGDVPFATRVDTLLKYLDKAPNANWAFEWVDGLERVDVKDGDKLIVTAEDGTTTKAYYISVNDYVKSENANLSAITWPDIPYYLDGWKGDTIPNFSPSGFAYQVLLPYGTKNVPALVAKTSDLNAKMTVSRATTLTGNQQQRTTSFTVVSENDSVTNVYSVLFSVEKRPEDVQLYKAEPFISEITGTGVNYFEFANVGDVPLDLSRYLFIWDNVGNTPAQALTRIGSSSSDWFFGIRYRWGYVPGYKFSDDTLEWKANPSKLYFDAAVNPVVQPGDVFVIGNPGTNVNTDAFEQADVIPSYRKNWALADTNYNTWGVTNLVNGQQMGMNWQQLFLWKIDNDSILDGTKDVNEDPEDYTLIDMAGDPNTIWQDQYFGNLHRFSESWNTNLSIRRAPWIYEGVPESDSTVMQRDWVANNRLEPGIGSIYKWIGNHTFDPVTAHKSTVSSTLYLVSDGYQGNQSIEGDLSGTTVSGFYGNVDKADPNQTFTMTSGTTYGDTLALDTNVSDGDTLTVVSANGMAETKYVLVNEPLDDNAVITVVEGASITIEIDGANGLIKGVPYGSVLKTVMDSLVIPELAVSAIIDQNGAPVPFSMLNNDSVLVDVVTGANIFIEVVAQNGVNKITYQFAPEALSSDAFVISTLYEVDQNNSTIEGLELGTAPDYFWQHVEVVEGATAQLVDKAGFERTIGNMIYDDKLEVTSEDGTVTKVYYLTFFTEVNPDGNATPTVSVAASSIELVDEMETTVSATAEDDGNPFGSVLTYSWSVVEGNGDDVSIADASALETQVVFSDTGTYKLRFVADDSEKSASADVSISVSSTVGIQLNTIVTRMYPNPANDQLFIEMEGSVAAKSTITIQDMVGRTVYTNNLNTSREVIDLSSFNEGLYFVRIAVDKQIITQKITVLKQ